MKKYFIIILLILLNSIMALNNTEFNRGNIIARFNSDISINTIEITLEKKGVFIKRILFKQLNIWLLQYDQTIYDSAELVLKILDNYPFIKYAQLDHKINERLIPNDPEFENMWHLHNTGENGGVVDADIDAPEAWNINTGGTTVLGQSIVVAIIDGGFQWNHQDLVENTWVNENEIADNGIDDDGNGYIDDIHGWDAFDNNGVLPIASHGTKVAGMIGAKGNNNIDVVGVNWNVDLMFIAGSSSITSTVIAAYGYALDNKLLWQDTDGVLGANVVATNSSFGINYADCNSGSYPVWNDMYNSLGEAGILSVAATMNINANVDEEGDVPTGCNSNYLIAVTNTTNDDIKYSSAAYGLESIDLGAPGTSVCSTRPTDLISCTLTGTSYSSPIVAGAVALVHAAGSNILHQEYFLYPSEIALFIKNILLNTVDPLSDLEGNTVSGGRLNLFNAVNVANQFNGICGIIGDINGDLNINVVDVVSMVSCILSTDCYSDNNVCMDLNEDGQIDIYDIILMINIILEV